MAQSYLLNRDSKESERLAEQHVLWLECLDYLIHPRVEKTLGEQPRIMDVGTGTGVWPLAIAALHPQWHCMGTDVSSDQFPPLESLGPNVKLQVSDLRESFPKAMLGHFDVVHARLLLLAMEDQHAWTVAVNNLSTLLKPGGWLQWEEANVNALGEVLRDRRNREQSASAMRRGFKRLEEIAGQRMVDVPQKLGKAFQAACLEDIEMDTVASDRLPESGRPTGTRMGIGVFEGVLKQRREAALKGRAPPLDGDADDDNQMIQAMRQEADHGNYVTFAMYCVAGRKAA